MRTARVKEDRAATYHVIARVVDRRRVINDLEKERFRGLMRQVEAFAGVKVRTYSLLDDHVHILLHVPGRQSVSDEELIRRLSFLYDPAQVKVIARKLEEFRAEGDDGAADALKFGYTYRMYELSEFVKTLKQRYTQSYNRRHERSGTLWESRFKSVLLGGNPNTLAIVAAYVDLNAIRAGIVDDPKDYRFCGYAEALSGSEPARDGIGGVMLSLDQPGDWPTAAAKYREWLYVSGEERRFNEDGTPTRRGFDREQVRAVLEAGGQLSMQEVLRCRVRYFSDGLVLGSRVFVEDVLARHQARFRARRDPGAEFLGGAAWGDLCSAHRLRPAIISVPAGV